jgi:cytoskeletal protein RodZ
MGTRLYLWLLVIELGDFTIRSETPLAEVLWFIGGLLLLVVLSTAVLWWQRRVQKDPFI